MLCRVHDVAGTAGCVLLVTACACGADVAGTRDGASTSAAATNYTNAALDIMQAHSINRYTIDWPSFRTAALERISGAQTPRDTYPAITATLVALGDHHSSFFAPGALPDKYPRDPSTLSAMRTATVTGGDPHIQPIGLLVSDDIGYVSIPGFTGSQKTPFADSVQAIVQELDASNPCGWIVDLRFDTGGNMWPMVAGIGPVLGDGDIGEFVNPDSSRQTWYYRDGAAGVVSPTGVEEPIQRVTAAYHLTRPMPPVAVMYSPSTASSGEAVAVAFRGRPLSRSFGRATDGLSTANAVFELSDGAYLNLTVATDADRTGTIYGGKLQPDETWTSTEIDPATDQAAQAAVAWLHQQAACTGS